MSDPRIVGLSEAITVLSNVGEYWAEDLFGPELSADEWAQVRSAGIPTERIASVCYRHALSVARKHLAELIADLREEDQ